MLRAPAAPRCEGAHVGEAVVLDRCEGMLGAVRGAIVDDDHLEIAHVLSEHRLHQRVRSPRNARKLESPRSLSGHRSLAAWAPSEY